VVSPVLPFVLDDDLASQSRIDPLSLAQNGRIQLPAGDSLEATQAPGFTLTKRKWADAGTGTLKAGKIDRTKTNPMLVSAPSNLQL